MHRLWEQWRQVGASLEDCLEEAGDLTLPQLRSVLLIDQQERWRRGERVLVESYLQAQQEVLGDEGILELIRAEISLRTARNEAPQLEEYEKRFPNHAQHLRGQFNASGNVKDRTDADMARQSEGSDRCRDATIADRGSEALGERTIAEARAVLPTAATQTAIGVAAGEAPGKHAPTVTAPALPSTENIPPRGHGRSREYGRPVIEGYEVLEELGRGGMGVVYKARQERLKRTVALKMILAGAHASAVELTRFRSEAESVARLQHPNIVQIYEIGEQDGCPFFSLEFIEGGTLVQQLGKSMPERAVLVLIEKLARAIHFAHLRGIVHRDLKPANVLLAADGSPKLTDFGLAKRLDDDNKDRGITRTGAILGTPSYMAPEQAAGNVREIGPATDIYSLGAILYELLTGRPPFRGATLLDTLEQLRTQEPVAPRAIQPRIHRDVETICLKCLQKDAAQRYASAQELAEDVHNFLTGVPIKARPTPAWERALKWAKRRPMVVSLLAVIACAFIGGIGLMVYHSVDLQRQLEQARLKEQELVLGKLRAEVQEMIQTGKSSVELEKWSDAERTLTAAVTKIGSESRLDDLKTRIAELLEEIRPKLQDQEGYRSARAKYDQYKKLHHDAIFHGSLFTGAEAASALEAARAAAEQALELYGVTLDNANGPQVDARFVSATEKADITSKSYELLLVLAEATLGRGPADERRRAEAALHVLDRARLLGFPLGKAYHLRRSRYHALLGDLSTANQERDLAARLKPSVALAYFWLGDEMLKQGTLAQAILEFENALRLQPDHFWAQYMLAVCQLRMQRPAQAKASLTACLSLRSDFLWIYSLRGFAHSELAEYDAALADFQKALDSNPDPVTRYGILVNRGVMRMRQDKLDDARADLLQAIALNPKQYHAYVNLAEVYQKRRQFDEGIRQFDRAIELEPGMALLYRNRARLHLLRNDDGAALHDLDKAIALEPNDSRAVAHLEDRVERAGILYRRKDYERALESARLALDRNADYGPAHRQLAEALLALKDYQGAAKEFDIYLKIEKADATVYQGRAAARANLGNYTGAIEDYTRALALRPDASTYAGRGWAYVTTNSLKLALADFEEAVRLDSANGYAFGGRGYVRVRLGQVRPGIADVEDALRHGPESPGLLHNAARTFAQAVGKLDEEAKTRPLNTQGLEIRFQYQDRALKLIGKVMDALPRKERVPFWNRFIKTDPDLGPIRRTPGFAQLEAELARNPGDR